MLVPITTKKIQIICPICKTRDLIGVPERELNINSHLTTISIHKGLICPHHFQIFVDRNLQIRGYQKVDFELNNENSKKLRNGVKAFNQIEKEEKDVFKNLVNDNNILQSKLSNQIGTKENMQMVQEIKTETKKKSMKEIYEEFWEFIEVNNENFREFLLSDKRRDRSLIDSKFNENYNHIQLDQEI